MNNLQKPLQLSCISLLALYVWQVFAPPHALNWDMLNVLAIAKLPLSELFHVLAIRDFHPPGVHLLLHCWINLFGEMDMSVLAFSAIFAILGAIGSGLVIRILSDCKAAGWVGGGLVLFSPFLHDPEAILQYVVHLAAAAFSWFFLLQLGSNPDTPSRRRWIGYGFSTLIAIHCFVTAAMIVPFQIAFVFLHDAYRQTRMRFLILAGILLLTLAPYAAMWMQPWHVAHNSDIRGNHPAASLYDLLLLPASLLFTRYDLIYFKPAFMLDGVFLCGLFGLSLLGFGLYRLYGQNPKALKSLLLLGVLPPMLVWGFGKLIDIPLFQNRTFLFCLPAMALAPAVLIADAFSKGRKAVAVLSMVGLLTLMQFFRIPFKAPPFEQYAAPVRDAYQAGDGIVLYPGMVHLGFMRYFRLEEFGLTDHERTFDPETENVYHIVHRIDDEFFIVTGDDVLATPKIQEALKQFIASHKRVLVIGFSPAFISAMNCQKNVFILNRQNQFEPIACVAL